MTLRSVMPLGCLGCRRWLDGIREANPDPDREAEVRAHLEGCADCRRYLAVRVVPARALRASGPTPVPADLADRAWRKAMAAPAPGFLDRFVPVAGRAALAAAAAALLLWGSVAALGSRPASSATVTPSDPLEVAVAVATEGNGGP